MSEPVWCEHMKPGSVWCSSQNIKPSNAPQFTEWNFCPVCGTQRPEPEIKSLAQKLYETFDRGIEPSFWNKERDEYRQDWQHVASIARELVKKELLEGKETEIESLILKNESRYRSVIAQLIIEYLNN